MLDSCNDRSLFLFQVWGPRLLPLAKLHMNSSSFGTWQVCKMPGFVKVCPFFSDLYQQKQNQIFIQLSFYLVLKENIGSFSKYCAFCFHEKSDFKFSYGDLPKISLNCKTAVLQIFLNFETEILSSQRECSFCCADISLTVRKLLLI